MIGGDNKMIEEEYTQLFLSHQIRGITAEGWLTNSSTAKQEEKQEEHRTLETIAD